MVLPYPSEYPLGVVVPARRAARGGPANRRLLALLALVVVLAVVAAVLLVVLPSGGRHPAAATGPTRRTQRTLLFGIGPPGGTAVAAALLAADPVHRTGSVLLFPSPTLAEAPGYGPTTVGGAFAHGLRVPQDTVEDLIGVTVDGTWRLTRVGLVRLVDDLGGIDIGRAHVSGRAAAAYVYASAHGGPAQEESARLQQLIDGLVGRLAHARIPHVLAGLRARSSTNFGLLRLASFLRTLAGSDYLIHQETVPLDDIDTGGAQPALEVDAAATHQFVLANLAASIPQGGVGTGAQVLVEDNTGRPQLVVQARDRLDGAKLDFIGSQTLTPLHTYRHSLVLIFSYQRSSISLGDRIAAALGLPASAVRVSPREGNDVAGAVVILGADFGHRR